MEEEVAVEEEVDLAEEEAGVTEVAVTDVVALVVEEETTETV